MYRGLIIPFLIFVVHHVVLARVVQQQQQQQPSNLSIDSLSSFQDVFEASNSAERSVNDMFRFIQDESISTTEDFVNMQNLLKNTIQEQYKRGIREIQGWENMPILSEIRDKVTKAFDYTRNNLVNRIDNASQQSLKSLQNVNQNTLPQAMQTARRSFENNIAGPLKDYLKALNGVGVGENNSPLSQAQEMQPSRSLDRRAPLSLSQMLNEDLDTGDEVLSSIQSTGTKTGSRFINRLRALPDYLDTGMENGNGIMKSAMSMGKDMRRQAYDRVQSLSDMIFGNKRQLDRGNSNTMDRLDEESTNRRNRRPDERRQNLQTENNDNARSRGRLDDEIETKVDFETDNLQRRSVSERNEMENIDETEKMGSMQKLGMGLPQFEGQDLNGMINNEGEKVSKQFSNTNENLANERRRQQQRVSNIGSQMKGSNLESMLGSSKNMPQSFTATTQTLEGRDLNENQNIERRVRGQFPDSGRNVIEERYQQEQRGSNFGNNLKQNLGNISDRKTNLMRRGVQEFSNYKLNSIPNSSNSISESDDSSMELELESKVSMPRSSSPNQTFKGRDINRMMDNERQQIQGQFSQMRKNLAKGHPQQVSNLENELEQNLGFVSGQGTNLMRRGVDELSTYGLDSVDNSADITNQINCLPQTSNIKRTATSATDGFPEAETMKNKAKNVSESETLINSIQNVPGTKTIDSKSLTSARSGPL